MKVVVNRMCKVLASAMVSVLSKELNFIHKPDSGSTIREVTTGVE
jgi:hypothetical protein